MINYFNPEGIPLIREKLELKWAPDSLFHYFDQNAPSISNDSSSLTNSKNFDEKNQEEGQLEKGVTKETEPVLLAPKETSEGKKETIAFAEPKAINLDQAYKLFNNGIQFVDARDEADYLAGHIANSINIPFDDFDNHQQKLEKLSKEKPLVIYCAGTDCDLSILLGNLLFEKGYKQVYVFFGGWLEWLNANYPVKYPNDNQNE